MRLYKQDEAETFDAVIAQDDSNRLAAIIWQCLPMGEKNSRVASLETQIL